MSTLLTQVDRVERLVRESGQQLDDMTQTAQGTLRSLQAERALAERIEQSNKTLRSRTTLTERKQA